MSEFAVGAWGGPGAGGEGPGQALRPCCPAFLMKLAERGSRWGGLYLLSLSDSKCSGPSALPAVIR